MLEPPLLASCRLTWWAWTGIAEWRTGFSSLAHRGGGVVAAWNVLLTLAKERAARHWPSNSRQCLAALEESTTIISRRRRRRRRRPVHLVCSGPARTKLRRLLISQSVGLFVHKSSTKIKVKHKHYEQDDMSTYSRLWKMSMNNYIHDVLKIKPKTKIKN